LVAAFVQPVVSRPALLSLHEGSQPTPRRLPSSRACDRVRHRFVRHRPAHSRSWRSPRDRRPACARPRITCSCDADRPRQAPLLGLLVPSACSSGAALSGACHSPDDAASALRMAKAVGVGPNPRNHRLVLAVFRLAQRPVTAALVSSPPRLSSFVRSPPAAKTFAGAFSVGPAFHSPLADLRRLAGWDHRILKPAALLGFSPFAALFRPDSSAYVVRRGGPPVVCPSHPPRFIFVEASAA